MPKRVKRNTTAVAAMQAGAKIIQAVGNNGAAALRIPGSANRYAVPSSSIPYHKRIVPTRTADGPTADVPTADGPTADGPTADSSSVVDPTAQADGSSADGPTAHTPDPRVLPLHPPTRHALHAAARATHGTHFQARLLCPDI